MELEELFDLIAPKIPGSVTQFDDKPFLLAPAGYQVSDMSEHLRAPREIRRHLNHASVESFVDYAREFAGGGSTVYVVPETRSLTLVVDDVTPDEPSWARHRSSYAAVFSAEYQAWAKLCSERAHTQKPLAEFLADRRDDIHQPSGAEVVGLIEDFRATQSASFRSAKNLANGDVQLEWATETKVGAVRVPDVIQLWLPIFDGGPHAFVRVRFGYRLNEGALTFKLEIANQVDLVRNAFEDGIVTPILGSDALKDVAVYRVRAVP